MTTSELTDYVRISPNTSGIRTSEISKITVHHMAGDCSVEVCGEIFANQNREASSNYGVGSDGRVGCYLEEEYHPWTSSSYWNDDRAVTIEVADYDLDEWSPSNAAYDATVNLCADICDRYGIEPEYTGDSSGTFTQHSMFAATSCGGPWWQEMHDNQQFIEDVKAAMEGDYGMNIEELLHRNLPTGSEIPEVPIWQLWSWAYTYSQHASRQVDEILAKLDELEKRIDGSAPASPTPAAIDYKALAKAVIDDAAERMKE